MIDVFRLAHRLPRDCRITTHVALTARAFGATTMHYSGMHDQEMEDAVKKVVEKFGGPFTTMYVQNEKKFLQEKKKEHYTLVHLTVYGIAFQDVIKNIKNENVLIIIGGEKVPPWIYTLVDYNTSIGNQPHSEVSALGIFLDHYHGPQELFTKAQQKIIGTEKGKKVISLE